MAGRFENRFRVVKKLGKGSFGEVFQGVDLKTKQLVAIKVERLDSTNPMLVHESRVLEALSCIKGIPKLHFISQEPSSISMVTDLLGPSFEELLNLSNRKMSLKSVLMLALQLFQLFEAIHNKNFIHRDIKPQNFLIGNKEDAGTVYAIDFGLAKEYSGKNGHIPFREGKSLTGTAKFVSIFTHLGLEQSRRDDLESLGYLIVYLLNGKLPWQEARGGTKAERHQKIFEVKSSTSISLLCSDLPSEINFIIAYSRSLKFEERPDYSLIRTCLQNLFVKLHFKNDSLYDWTRLSSRKDSMVFEDSTIESVLSSDA